MANIKQREVQFIADVSRLHFPPAAPALMQHPDMPLNHTTLSKNTEVMGEVTVSFSSAKDRFQFGKGSDSLVSTADCLCNKKV